MQVLGLAGLPNNNLRKGEIMADEKKQTGVAAWLARYPCR